MARNDLEGLHQEEVEGPDAVVDRSNEGEFLLSVSDDEADVIELRDVNWSTDNHEDGIRHREAPLEARRFKSSDSELGGIFNGMDLHDLRSNDVGLISDDEFKQEFSDVSDALHPKKLAYVNDDTHGPLGENLDKSTVHPLVIKFLRTVGYILVWYILSTCLTVYNKELLGKTLGKFPAPLLMNTVHFTLQAITSKVMLRYWCAPMRPTVKLSWRDYFLRVVPTATATALDVNLSNESFVFISVTFATMCKSAAPVFLLLFAFAFRLESPNLKLLGIIVIISSGVLLTAAKETEFDVVGFVLVMLATVMAGFRWTVTQLLLQKEEYGLNNPLAVLSNLTPVMAVLTFVCSIILEPWHMLGVSSYFNSTSHALQSCALMLLGGLLAFCMVMTEFTVISETSAVTLTVAGVVKEVVTIVVAIFFFHDSFTVVKGIGLVVIIVGVCLFNWFKYQKLVHGQNGPLHRSVDPAVGNMSVRYSALEDIIDDASDPGARL